MDLLKFVRTMSDQKNMEEDLPKSPARGGGQLAIDVDADADADGTGVGAKRGLATETTKISTYSCTQPESNHTSPLCPSGNFLDRPRWFRQCLRNRSRSTCDLGHCPCRLSFRPLVNNTPTSLSLDGCLLFRYRLWRRFDGLETIIRNALEGGNRTVQEL